MFLQRRLAGVVIFGVEVPLIGYQGHFGIDDHVLFLRQTNNDVGLHSRTGLGFNADLSLIFMALAQTRGLQHAG